MAKRPLPTYSGSSSSHTAPASSTDGQSGPAAEASAVKTARAQDVASSETLPVVNKPLPTYSGSSSSHAAPAPSMDGQSDPVVEASAVASPQAQGTDIQHSLAASARPTQSKARRRKGGKSGKGPSHMHSKNRDQEMRPVTWDVTGRNIPGGTATEVKRMPYVNNASTRAKPAAFLHNSAASEPSSSKNNVSEAGGAGQPASHEDDSSFQVDVKINSWQSSEPLDAAAEAAAKDRLIAEQTAMTRDALKAFRKAYSQSTQMADRLIEEEAETARAAQAKKEAKQRKQARRRARDPAKLQQSQPDPTAACDAAADALPSSSSAAAPAAALPDAATAPLRSYPSGTLPDGCDGMTGSVDPAAAAASTSLHSKADGAQQDPVESGVKLLQQPDHAHTGEAASSAAAGLPQAASLRPHGTPSMSEPARQTSSLQADAEVPDHTASADQQAQPWTVSRSTRASTAARPPSQTNLRIAAHPPSAQASDGSLTSTAAGDPLVNGASSTQAAHASCAADQHAHGMQGRPRPMGLQQQQAPGTPVGPAVRPAWQSKAQMQIASVANQMEHLPGDGTQSSQAEGGAAAELAGLAVEEMVSTSCAEDRGPSDAKQVGSVTTFICVCCQDQAGGGACMKPLRLVTP